MSANPPVKSTILRMANAWDNVGIARLAKVCHEELLAPLGMRFDLDHTARFFGEALGSDPDFVAVVVTHNGEVVGCASGTHAENWVSPDQTIFVADSWFLHPDHRQGDLASG